jgi:ATP sulfurylase
MQFRAMEEKNYCKNNHLQVYPIVGHHRINGKLYPYCKECKRNRYKNKCDNTQRRSLHIQGAR